MKVLLTGATGFVGAALAKALLDRGHTVRAAYLPGDDLTRIRAIADRLERRPLDLRALSEADWDGLTAGCESCIHAAWYTTPGRYLVSDENLACVEMTLSLLRALARNGTRRLLGLGTCAEYDLEQADAPLPETAPIRPTTLYAASKVAVYEVAREYARLHEMSFAWCRLFYLYGVGESPRRLVPDVIQGLLRGEPVPVTHGRQFRDYLYIEDAAQALVTILESDLAGPVNVGSGKSETVRTLIETIGAQLGRAEKIQWGAREENRLDPAHVCADVSKLTEATDWRPTTGLADGLEKTIAWWKKQL